MKRPSGFDRGAEGPESDAPDTQAPEWDTAGGDGVADHPDATAADSPARPGLFDRLRSRTAREAAAARAADQGGAESSAAGSGEGLGAAEDAVAPGGGSGDALAPGDGSGDALAPTVDLSAVRRARAEVEDGEIELVDDAPSARSAVTRWRAARQADPVRAAERRVREAGKQRKARFRRERQRFTLAARRRRRTWLIVISAVAALALFVVVGVFTPLMAVREVNIEGASAVNAEEVGAALARFEGVPLALVEDRDVHRALERFPLIQRYAVERTPPHTMTVRIEERVPVVSLPSAGGVGLYDAAGVLLGSAEAAPAGVPLGSGSLTDRSSDAFRSASRALRDMPAELRAQITSVTASSGQDVTFVLSSGVQVLWGDSDQTRRKSTVLTSMLAALADRPISQIDVSSSEAPVFQ